MADIIKVKPKKKYEWNQDKKYLYVQVPLPAHTSLKKVQIYISDLIFRVTSLEKNQTQYLDLAQQIDYQSPENKFILTNGLLHATLKKTSADQQWTNLLIQGISLAELRQRRKESEKRKEQYLKTVQQTKDKLRVEHDNRATKQLMRFEEEQRKQLEFKKKVEHDEAIRSVFSNVNEKTGQFQKEKKTEKILELERSEEKWKQKQQLALTLLEEQETKEKEKIENTKKEKNKTKIIEEVTKKYQKQKSAIQNSMFTEEQVEKYDQMRQNIEDGIQYEEIPVRKATTQKVNFTERVHKNMAARDTFIKEPPMPQSKGNKLSNGDLESKNPLWLKDKGDSFFQDKNYISAIEAYSEALKADSKLTSAILNRCACYMKTFKLQQAINDCDQAMLLLQSQISGDEQEQANSRLTLGKIKTRKAICSAWKGELQTAKKILKQVQQLELTEVVQSEVEKCLQQISKREESIKNKAKGDELVKLNNHEGAVIHYDKAIQTDENQYAISNKVLCFNKLKRYREASDLADKGIKKLGNFSLGVSNVQTNQDKQASLILLKLFYRKAKALEEQGLLNEAEGQLRKGLAINSQDKDLKQYLKQLKKKQNKEVIKKLKEESASFIKQSKIKEALQNYSKCLKMLQEAEDVQQYLAILQNQCVCYQKINKFDDVLSTCIRILKLVNRLQSKILQFGNKKHTPQIEKEQLKKISVRTLVRRANAYVKTSQYYNAKSDLEKALEISPDETIRKELDNLKSKLSSSQ